MLLSVSALLFAQLAARQPVEAAYVIHGDYGASRRAGNLQRLLDEWAEQGVVRARRHGHDRSVVAPCVPRRHHDPVDLPCVARVVARANGPAPVVAVIARDSGRVTPVLNVVCVGPDGVGRASVNMNYGGAFSSIGAERDEIRGAMASCLNAALQGAVVRP
jgi:hypothetical protein